jgi:DedD protein
MEEQLKARLIGASVLVLLAVVLIPELLSARKPASGSIAPADAAHGMHTYTIELGGGVGGGTKDNPIPAPGRTAPATPAAAERTATKVADATVPGEPQSNSPVSPATTSAADAQTVRKPVQAGAAATGPAGAAPVKAAASTTDAAGATAPRASPKSGQWAVQVGAFGSKSSADKLIGELQRAGFTAFEAPLDRGGKTLHRVRVGPEAEHAEADRLAGRLKGRGLPATVVANE